MTADTQEIKNLLLQRNEHYRQLADRHHELDDRLHELSSKHFLSEPEQVEEITLKKRKLQVKDEMEALLREYRQSISA